MTLSKLVAPMALVAILAAAAGPALQQAKIPVRELAPAVVSRETIGAVLGVRQLTNGRVLVSDAVRKRLLAFDSTLATVSVVLDSTPGLANSYGTRGAPIIAYLADSSLFFDFTAKTLLVIDPAGRVARAMAVPNQDDLNAMSGSAAFVDDRGRLVYRGLAWGSGGRLGAGGSPLMVMMEDGNWRSNADSQPLLRADFQARKTDTLASLKNAHAMRVQMGMDAKGVRMMTLYTNPIQTSDEWSMVSDGTVAIVRGHDYHVDWIAPDGKASASAKLPFDWKRIDDADKRRILDSARVRDSLDREAGIRAASGLPVSGPPGAAAAAGGGNVGRGGRGGGDDAPVTRGPPPTRFMSVPVSEVPDYLPPVRAGAARGDIDGNLWILPATSAQSLHGELVYDVVNRKGELFERVRVPAGRLIVGFGKGGVVYMTSGNLKDGFRLERTRIQP